MRDQVVEAQEGGADYIHIDLMDGQFVSNLTMGPLIVNAVRKSTDLPLDVHMMVLEPSRFVNELVDIGADILTVHFESAKHIHRTILDIKKGQEITIESIALTNMLGQQVQNWNVRDQDGIITVSTQNIARGNYIVVMDTNYGTQSRKVIIQ